MSINNIQFIPTHLKDSLLNNKELSEYDGMDEYYFHRGLYSVLTTNRIHNSVMSSEFSELINIYTKEGVYVFNEDTITIDDVVVFEIVTKKYPDNEYPDMVCCEGSAGPYTTVHVVCNKGSTNIVLNRDVKVLKKVVTWLMDYMFKRLGEKSVYETRFFKDYWLNC